MLVVAAVQAATFLTNPIFLVVAAVVLLVAGIVLLWKRSKTFRNIVLGMWDAIKKAASAVANWVKRVWTEAHRPREGLLQHGSRRSSLAVFNVDQGPRHRRRELLQDRRGTRRSPW